ncbi:MAG: hypothetical protein R3195_13395 [Gemmatimonadota bacterium]|nr:hypothetical protein [Gemmatimonadota bacterium]
MGRRANYGFEKRQRELKKKKKKEAKAERRRLAREEASGAGEDSALRGVDEDDAEDPAHDT